MQAARVVLAIAGAALVILTGLSVVRALVIPRARPGGVSRSVDMIVDSAFRVVTRRLDDYEDRDRVLAGQAAGVLVGMLVVWLAGFLIGYALLLWPWANDF